MEESLKANPGWGGGENIIRKPEYYVAPETLGQTYV